MSPSTLPGDKRPDYQASFSPVKESRSAKEVAGAAEKASQSAVRTSVEGGGGRRKSDLKVFGLTANMKGLPVRCEHSQPETPAD